MNQQINQNKEIKTISNDEDSNQDFEKSPKRRKENEDIVVVLDKQESPCEDLSHFCNLFHSFNRSIKKFIKEYRFWSPRYFTYFSKSCGGFRERL